MKEEGVKKKEKGRTRKAEVYPEELCREIVLGLRDQMMYDGRMITGGIGAVTPAEEDKGSFKRYWDDISGEQLNSDMVDIARKEEMVEVKKHAVYDKVDLTECYEKTGKPPIKTRWVDINKGDRIHPEYRSRLVAQEFNTGKREDLFAATPPLEAKKMLFSMAVTEGIGYQEGQRVRGKCLDFIDVRRAYFHAAARRTLYVELPPEDTEEGKCGKLNKAMYGTRDAAQNWEFEYTSFTVSYTHLRAHET